MFCGAPIHENFIFWYLQRHACGHSSIIPLWAVAEVIRSFTDVHVRQYDLQAPVKYNFRAKNTLKKHWMQFSGISGSWVHVHDTGNSVTKTGQYPWKICSIRLLSFLICKRLCQSQFRSRAGAILETVAWRCSSTSFLSKTLWVQFQWLYIRNVNNEVSRERTYFVQDG